MITKIEFRNLRAITMSYTALGGIRFYDASNKEFNIGSVISSSSTMVETTELIARIPNSYNSSTYAPIVAVGNNYQQLGDYGHYWLSSGDGYTFSIEFKSPQTFNKVEYVTRPSWSTDRGIDQPFEIVVYTGYGGSEKVIQKENIIPSMVNMKISETKLYGAKSLFVDSLGDKNIYKSFKNQIVRADLKLTANISPTIKATASSENSTTYQAFKAFNGSNTSSNDAWITQSGVKTGWLKIDFGKKHRTNCFYIRSRNSSELSAPVAFRILGSDDDVNWNTLKEVRNQVNWGTDIENLFYFNKVAYYRFYKLEIIEGSEASYVAIGGLDFAYDTTGITELPDKNEETLWKYGGIMSSLDQPISAYNYIINKNNSSPTGKYWTKKITNKPLYISIEKGEGY